LVCELFRTQQAQEGVGIDCVGRDEPVVERLAVGIGLEQSPKSTVPS
jgi:hypothetical protein